MAEERRKQMTEEEFKAIKVGDSVSFWATVSNRPLGYAFSKSDYVVQSKRERYSNDLGDIFCIGIKDDSEKAVWIPYTWFASRNKAK